MSEQKRKWYTTCRGTKTTLKALACKDKKKEEKKLEAPTFLVETAQLQLAAADSHALQAKVAGTPRPTYITCRGTITFQEALACKDKEKEEKQLAAPTPTYITCRGTITFLEALACKDKDKQTGEPQVAADSHALQAEAASPRPTYRTCRGTITTLKALACKDKKKEEKKLEAPTFLVETAQLQLAAADARALKAAESQVSTDAAAEGQPSESSSSAVLSYAGAVGAALLVVAAAVVFVRSNRRRLAAAASSSVVVAEEEQTLV